MADEKREEQEKRARNVSIAREFLQFNETSKSPFHAAHTLSTNLSKHGFSVIQESDDWECALSRGGRYMFTRDGSSFVAFSIGSEVDDSHGSFSIVGAHTDSPCLKVKPISKICAHGFVQLGVECYGGGLWHTWFDRDLTVAGRAIVREGGLHKVKLVSIDKAIMRIPNLAIHLQRGLYTDGFKPNKESEMRPVLATELAAGVAGVINGGVENGAAGCDRHPAVLLECLARELGCEAADIVDVDLCVADMQPGVIGGVLDEFVFAPRLDNLVSCFTAMRALIDASDDTECSKSSIRMIACFDHEEVGSTSSHGANSTLLQDSMVRICKVLRIDYPRAVSRSILMSADMAHAHHPNYGSKHEARHKPGFGKGLVVKTNQNQRYATSGVTGFVVREAGRRVGAEVQEFVVANDMGCGSTIGPMVASRCGLRTVDVGQAQLSMHSIREMCAVDDFYLAEVVVGEVLKNHAAILGGMGGGEIGM